MEYIAIIIIIGFIYEAISWFHRIHTASLWIEKERGLFDSQIPIPPKRIVILLPVLNESAILNQTVRYFSTNFLENSENVRLAIITTGAETLRLGQESTIDIAHTCANRYRNVMHYHYPNATGRMAHQLNYAIEILRAKGEILDDDLISVYNGDSRPEKQTLNWIQWKSSESKCKAFQQYGCYSGNMSGLGHSKWSSVLVSAALWQTRWAVGFEIYNAIKQVRTSQQNKKMSIFDPLNYCIGHGLFITSKLLNEVGGFSENTHNEDAMLGLQLSNLKELLIPVPYFDVSESPDTLKMLYIQKSNWFFGPLQSYAYARKIFRESNYSISRSIRLIILSLKLFSHAVFWILGPTLMFILICITIISHKGPLIFFTLVASVLFAAPNISSYSIMMKHQITSSRLGYLKMAQLLFKGFLVFYLMHGLSAIRGLSKYTIQLLSGRVSVKEKTIINRYPTQTVNSGLDKPSHANY